MTASNGIWFVYRSPGEGPLSKRVRRLEAPSVLAWFQAMIEEARTSLTPRDVARADLGGPVQGLGAFFEVAKEKSLHTPKTTATLSKVLGEHLPAPGGTDHVRVDAHSVRVLTGGDEPGSYFFFDEEAVEKHPTHLADLLSEDPEAAPPASADPTDWDPFRPKAAPKAPKVAKPKAEKAPGKAKPKAEKAGSKEERAWATAVAGRTADDAQAYRSSARFREGELIEHTKFGLGVVTRVEPTKCEVIFREGPRVLVQGATA